MIPVMVSAGRDIDETVLEVSIGVDVVRSDLEEEVVFHGLPKVQE